MPLTASTEDRIEIKEKMPAGLPVFIFLLGMFALFENLFVYTLQVFIPLGFNDGSTILRNLQKKSS